MKICDLCEARVDVSTCVIQLPQVKECDATGDLCAGCQRKVHEFMKSVRTEQMAAQAVVAKQTQKKTAKSPNA